MAKKLVVVESPAKAKTIGKILGSEYLVKASMGHIRDLPLRVLGVDLEKKFEPKYVLVPGRKRLVDDLRKAAKECDSVYLAPDPDREGEAIAWHLREVLKKSNKDLTFLRVQYNEITPRAVRKAFETPGELDMRRVDAQQARRVLDRIVGYKVSPMLWRRVKRGLSAGRVQSVALRLVCEREAQIRGFVSEAYWLVGARVRKLIEPVDPFKVRLIRIGKDKAEVKSAGRAEELSAEIRARELKVLEVVKKQIRRGPPPPFITSTLQQAASTFCGFSPKRTMMIAQRLYEGVDLGGGPVGLITYMRTDSFTISQDAQAECREYIGRTFGAEYVPEKPNVYKNRSGAQGAHEAIRPTDASRTPESVADRLDVAERKLYDLIWRRFVASQAAQALMEQSTARIEASPRAGSEGEAYLFQASATQVLFPGHMRIAGMYEDKKEKEKEDEDGTESIPPLVSGERLECLEVLTERKDTQPPPRYSEASLVRALESNGVGRPSTYAQILGTLEQRKYVQVDRRTISPSELGEQVNKLLVEVLGQLFDVKFTAGMEESLDRIEDGSVDWTSMLRSFYSDFETWMKVVADPPGDVAAARRILAMLENVKEWKPEVKKGKRTLSDAGFAQSLREQIAGDDGRASKRQIDALARIAVQYMEQVPGLRELLLEVGYESVINEPAPAPVTDRMLAKMALAQRLEPAGSTAKFVGSLNSRLQSGRGLTEPQERALDRIILSMVAERGELRAEADALEIKPERLDQDEESGVLIQAFGPVVEWRAPSQRGKRTFDDKSFYESLRRQYEVKNGLSDRQKQAMKKMLTRYKKQIPDFAALAERLGLKMAKAADETGKGD